MMLAVHNFSNARGWPVSARLVFGVIAVFYTYGALVHVLNMLSLTGFDWGVAPLKWRILDVTYLALDIVVAFGLVRAPIVGVAAFFCAATSQIVLYTALRDWIVDVPVAFQRSTEEIAYLDTLVIFHVATCIIIVAVLLHSRARTGFFSARREN